MAAGATTKHYIVLIQPNENYDSRRYCDYDSLYECMEGIVRTYDDFLKKAFPSEPEMIYNMAALIKFVNSLKDLSCMVYDRNHNMYKVYNKEWILQELYKHLSKNKDD